MYNEKEIKETTNIFKAYVRSIVRKSSYKFKKNFYKKNECLFSDFSENRVSLSNFDDDIFFCADKQEIYEEYNEIYKFTKREEQIIKLILDNYEKNEILKILQISDGNYRRVLSGLRNKMGGKINGR